jgi:hypothetical protein
MDNIYPKPKWWRLYAIAPVTLTLLVIDSQLALPSLGHKLLEILIVLVTVALMGLWVLANAVALEWSDIADEQLVRTLFVSPSVSAQQSSRLRHNCADGWWPSASEPAQVAQSEMDALAAQRNN